MNQRIEPSRPGSLPEFKHYRPQAGHPDWPRLAEEAQQLARELGPNLERPIGGLRALARTANAYRTAAQNYFINRRLARQGRWDLRPLYFIWTTTRVCNFLCKYCDDHRGRRYPELPLEGALTTEQGKQLLRVMRTRTPSVYFSGGEPTVRDDLPQLTRAAWELDYRPITVNTNGSLIHKRLKKPEWRTWLADTDIVVVSLDSLDVAALADMWVTKRPQEVVRNLLLMRELAPAMGVKLMVNTVIQPGHVREAANVLDLANDLGIWFAPVPMNVGPRVNHVLHEDPDYRALRRRILERKRKGYRITGSLRMNRRLLHSEPLTCRNTLKPHIDYDGKLVWPCKSTWNVEPAYVDVLAFDHVDALYAHASRKIEPTRFHGPAANQCGASCNWAQNYTTDAYAHGLENPLSLLGEVHDFVAHR